MVRETVRRGGTLFFCGNGGSAADAQHMATEYVVRYTQGAPCDRRGGADDGHLGTHRHRQ